MMRSAEVSEVSRNVATEGETAATISRIMDSGMTPGPLGIADTSPSAEAPASTAILASSALAMQHTLTRGIEAGWREKSVVPDRCLMLLPEKKARPGNSATLSVLEVYAG